MASSLNLQALAEQGAAQDAARVNALYGAQQGWAQSAQDEQGGMLSGLLAGDQRGQAFESSQNLLDAALARQEAALREATARAQAAAAERRFQLTRQDARSEAEFQAQQAAAEDEEWYRRQKFTTDENLRQQITLMQLQGGGEDEPGMHEQDYGSRDISTMRGMALKRDFGDQYAPSRAQMDIIEALATEYGSDPLLLQEELRKPESEGGLGRRRRTASYGLAELGYGLG